MANKFDLEDLKQKALIIRAACEQMNQRINEIGEIPKSDQTIKNWHDYDNVIWRELLDAVVIIDQCHPVDQHLVQDANTLAKHLNQYGEYTENLLYPEPKVTNQLSKKLTHVFNAWDRSETVKSMTFRTMMRIRELYCTIIDLDLPNDDSSQGRLTARPVDKLFDF